MGYFFSKSPSTCVLKISGILSPFTSSSLAASPFVVHLKLNSRPTGNFSPTAFLISSFPSKPVTFALTSLSFSALQSHTTTINLSALSPCRKIFMTSLSANTTFSSASFLFQVPNRAALSSFLSPANAIVLVRDRRRAPGQPSLGGRCSAANVSPPQETTTTQQNDFSNIRRSFRNL